MRKSYDHRRTPAAVHPTPLDLHVTIVGDAPRTPAWDALWRILLGPAPPPLVTPPEPSHSLRSMDKEAA